MNPKTPLRFFLESYTITPSRNEAGDGASRKRCRRKQGSLLRLQGFETFPIMATRAKLLRSVLAVAQGVLQTSLGPPNVSGYGYVLAPNDRSYIVQLFHNYLFTTMFHNLWTRWKRWSVLAISRIFLIASISLSLPLLLSRRRVANRTCIVQTSLLPLIGSPSRSAPPHLLSNSLLDVVFLVSLWQTILECLKTTALSTRL